MIHLSEMARHIFQLRCGLWLSIGRGEVVREKALHISGWIQHGVRTCLHLKRVACCLVGSLDCQFKRNLEKSTVGTLSMELI
jgi:hypothetical protein